MMNDNDRPRRAAQHHLNATSAPHGRQVTPRAHNTHDLGAYVHTNEDGQLAYPHPASAAERTGNVIEAKIAANPKRHGDTQASENLAQRSGAEQAFVYGFQTDRAASTPFYQAKIAEGRSPVADGQSPQPTWATENVQRSHLDFMFGTATVRAEGNIPPLSARSSVSQVGTDLSRLDLTERGRVTYSKAYGSDLRIPRRNESQVWE